LTVLSRALCLCLAAFAAPVAAQNVVTSSRPDHVELTIYRDPDRAPGDAFDLSMLNGYALISETRRVTLPTGESEIRFEGVAGGIVPQSAIVAGFPQGIVERNRDAYLLSPSTLVDASLGRRVHLRRTSRETGAVTETEAVIRSEADGGVVVQTAAGIEALRCAGQSETLIYPSVPPGLATRPTLSVRVRAGAPVTATVRLAYLASGFDWQANYVANLAEDGRHIDLFAWLTLASNDETSFVNASAQAVAGHVNREEVDEQEREGGPLRLQCWPAATTSDIPLEVFQRMAMGRGQALPIPGGQEVVVTGSRIRRAYLESASPITALPADQMASRENLGDLKLYRIPEPVTIAANSQKQVAFLVRQRVAVHFAWRQDFNYSSQPEDEPVRYLLSRNREAEGLGEPLPGGGFILLTDGPDRPILLGDGALGDDRTVGDDVEVSLGETAGLFSSFHAIRREGNVGYFELLVTNNRPSSAVFEGALHFPGLRADRRLVRRNGDPLWRVEIPANGRARLCFRAEVPEWFRPPATLATGEATCFAPRRSSESRASPAAAGDSRQARRR
jgi:hypothetical protein